MDGWVGGQAWRAGCGMVRGRQPERECPEVRRRVPCACRPGAPMRPLGSPHPLCRTPPCAGSCGLLSLLATAGRGGLRGPASSRASAGAAPHPGSGLGLKPSGPRPESTLTRPEPAQVILALGPPVDAPGVGDRLLLPAAGSWACRVSTETPGQPQGQGRRPAGSRCRRARGRAPGAARDLTTLGEPARHRLHTASGVWGTERREGEV